MGIQRTGEIQESPQDFFAAGTGQAISPPKPPEDENGRRAIFLLFYCVRMVFTVFFEGRRHFLIVLLCAYGFYNVF